MYGDEMGQVETYATFFDNGGNKRSGKKLGTVAGEQRCQSNCAKNDNWVNVKYEVPKWENNLEIRISIINGGEAYSGTYFVQFLVSFVKV